MPSLRILVVDDQPDVRELLVDMLRDEGHTVRGASSGMEALAQLEAGDPVDLVLTDLWMPGIAGLDLSRAVKARWPTVLVGVITGWLENPDAPTARAPGVTFVLTKPFTIQKLRDALNRLPRP